jgi:hypothetical protein
MFRGFLYWKYGRIFTNLKYKKVSLDINQIKRRFGK